MSQSISNVSSNQPFVPIENVRTVGVQPSVADISDKSLSEIVAEYKKLFVDDTDTSYVGMKKGCLNRLGYILDQGTKYSDNFNKLSEIYTDARTINNKEIDGVSREGYMAFRFYVKSIVDYLQMLHTYINEAQTVLEKLQEIIDMPDVGKDGKLQLAREHIDKLSVCKTFADETVDALVKHHQYNNDTKQWEIVSDRNDMLFDGEDKHSKLKAYEDYIDVRQISPRIERRYPRLDWLRETKIYYKDSRASDGMIEAPIQVFSSLPLIDRMKFIYYFYKIILSEWDSSEKMYLRYINFPDDPETGFPCIPDVESTKDTEATKHLGALEMFYVGYLTDRDGPINAVSSFFEVKVQALRENLSIQSKSISALNTYLEFINRGLNVLNGSQSGADGDKTNHRIPEGAMIALTYLCGGNMYNLAEAGDGTKCLVIEHNRSSGHYMLVSADDAGMNFLLGDNGNTNEQVGNCYSDNQKVIDTWYAKNFSYSQSPTVYCYSTGTEKRNGQTRYNKVTASFGNTFVLPTRLDCANVIPNSVKEYGNFKTADKIKTEVVSSWTDAFSKKTQFINTAIDTINTDIQVDRSKIDSFDSICSTFRSRAHEAHSNTAANVR